MRPISDYLKKLLYQYDCLVVPALGAFLTHGVSASYNETTGQFLPPRRKVAFNEALRLDDGILLNYVMLHEDCSREEALGAIGGFVATLKNQAQAQGNFVIDGLGLFSYNSEQKLQFDPELRHNFLGGAYGLQPLVLTRQMVHPAVPVREKPLLTKPLPSSALIVVNKPTGTSVGEVMPLPVTRPRTQPLWRWAAVAVMASTLAALSYFSVKQPNQSQQSSLNPGTFFTVSTRTTTATRPAEAAVVSPAPVAAADNATSASPVAAPTAKPVAATVNSTPALASVSTARSKPVAEVTVTKPALLNVPFTVIAGSFANRGNAIRFQKRLEQSGYEQAYILPGRTKGLIKVAALGTDDMAVAKASLDSLRDLTGINPWIMRRR